MRTQKTMLSSTTVINNVVTFCAVFALVWMSATRVAVAQESAERVEKEARAALTNMLTLLEDGKSDEFIHQHVPIREYVGLLARVKSGQTLPKLNARQLEALTRYVLALRRTKMTVHPSGRFVRMTKPAVESSDKPALKNPYNDDLPTTTAGYGKDLIAAIRAAVDDLEAGNSEEFAGNMFPPSMIAMMKAESRWKSVVEKLDSGTPQRRVMLQDLRLLASSRPEIVGSTATFQLDRQVVQPGRREGPEQYVDGKRTIKFSLINGHWKFFDNTARITQEIKKALDRDMPASIGQPEEFGLEKIGSDWRLTSLPQI